MSIHSYNLRSKINSPAGVKTPTATPTSKAFPHNPRRSQQQSTTIQLDHVVGTTTKDACGLSACAENNTFAYCAGSVAVLARVDDVGTTTHRYYRARPAAIPLNPLISYYSTPTSTPTTKRSGLGTPRRDGDYDTPSRAPLEDENVKTWTARERIKSMKCVSLSPNGKFFAVGESGYNPRVLLFSTSKDCSSETPLSVITDHTWGVRSVAFSPDSCFLATLGEANDGFLFIWSVNPKTGGLRLCATNKCTSTICHMTWCGQHLITVGLRHIKVWQLPDNDRPSPTKRSRLRNGFESLSSAGPIPLPGRNCLLGNLVDVTFTCIVAAGNNQALVCTDSGSICTVDVSKSPAELIPVGHELHLTGAMGWRETCQRLVWAGGGGEIHDIGLGALLTSVDARHEHLQANTSCMDGACCGPRRSGIRQSLGLSQPNRSGIVAIACLTKHTVYIDTESNLTIFESRSADSSLNSTPKLLLSHNRPVQGVQAISRSADLGSFFTWSKDGEVRFWNAAGQLERVEKIQLEEGLDNDDVVGNELKLLRYAGNGFFLSGDRYGVLKIIQSDSWRHLQAIRAHSAEINDVCIDHTSTYVATASRDRNVQILKLQDSIIELLQTTDDHIASVNQVTFNHDGGILLSCSADRTIVVREKACRGLGDETLVAFLSIRIITIKAAPLSMCLIPGAEDLLLISSLDRHVTKIDFVSGTIIESFKVTDPEADDNAVLNSIQSFANTDSNGVPRMLVGVSTIDKSIRLYDLDKRALLWKEAAHTEGISDVALIESIIDQNQLNKRKFVSTGLDSTIMIWTMAQNNHSSTTPNTELSQDQLMLGFDSDNTPAKASPAILPPLRKVLTKADIAEFAKSHSPRTPTREPSPVRLKRKGSRLALATSALEDDDRVSLPAPKRRASCDDQERRAQRSPSPPPYATKRNKLLSNKRELTKDVFTKPNDKVRRSPSPQVMVDATPTEARVENRANKTRLRRPPSIPADLRSKALGQRRSSTVLPLNDATPLSVATDHVSQVLQKYRNKIQVDVTNFDFTALEEELNATLNDIRKAKNSKVIEANESQQRTGSTKSRPSRQHSTNGGVADQVKRNNSMTEGEPEIVLSVRHKATSQDGSEKSNLGVEGLSVLLEKTNLGSI